MGPSAVGAILSENTDPGQLLKLPGSARSAPPASGGAESRRGGCQTRMVEATLSELAALLGADVVGDPTTVVDGACNDTRELRVGALFVALVAERDGHDFVDAARSTGASAAMVSRPVPVDLPQLVVEDTAAALLRLGGWARDRLSCPVIGVTGSVGKTTTKDLLAAIFVPFGPAAASRRSFNNEVGVPLTLFDADPSAVVAVVEMGARGPGHIALLCDVAAPTTAVVTAVTAAHVETFGSLASIAEAKGELVQALPRNGLAVLNADDPPVIAMAERTAAPVLTFGDAGEVRASRIGLDAELRAGFVLHTPWGSGKVRLGVRGAHNVANALAAAAAALGSGAGIGVGVEAVAEGLSAEASSPWRMELSTSPQGARILNDAYNANPASMRAALTALASLPAARRVAVLGPMAELGESGPAEHLAVAEFAAGLGVEVVAVGTADYGIVPVDDPVAALGPIDEGVAVLVKASRAGGLETVAAQFAGRTRRSQ